MQDQPLYLKMKKQDKFRERLKDKTELFLKVNHIGTLCCLVLAILCYFLLKITAIIPWILLGFVVLNFINLYAFRTHKNLTLTYNIASLMGLAGSVAIVLYSGGINSPFIFILAVLVFAGYVTTRVYGRIYLIVSLVFLVLIYSQSVEGFSRVSNVVPENSRELFALFSIMLSVYLLGGVFGRNLLSAHHKLYRSKGEIEQRMQEKEMLLKEVHHRVKNNLQTVSSLLRMQSREIDDKDIQNLLQGSQNRVVCMAMVHEMLYMRDDLAKIEYRSYVEDLGAYLIKSIKGPKSKIRLNIDIPDIELGIDTAIPLGLLINEAVTNALKYGFKDLDEGEITIALERENKTEYILRIGDNGVGFPEEITPASTKSLGLKLIHNLSRQLKGDVIRDFSKKGTNYIIHFQEAAQAPFHTLA
ncbi:Two-component sensor histidine kinase, contains HisKA and HATPase domains [Robiginitalea myxolifaciens]|uniref:histidine kinase n=2 Tax=Robiginitalea myxolifaciens TaxID=400055 RepID=A0A1I6H6X1_9FLAO|nr:Two-component sensor histidine kinase, contains HisKA and HATPase domains [Robiginitalea myxolifaciens]